MASINYFSQDVSFKLPSPRKTSTWIKSAVKAEDSDILELNYIFCSDNYLSEINLEYLNHKTLTDIITFDNRDADGPLEGDIFISVDRVRENATKLNVPFIVELHRVIIHGVLHLLGYSDKSPAKKKEMREKEDAYLSLL